MLQPGPNSVAVAIANYGAAAASPGRRAASARRATGAGVGPPAPSTAWPRSSYARRSSPAALELAARGAGLTPAALRLQAAPATPRPSVE